MHVLGRREIGTGFWRGNVKEREHFEGLGIEARIILKYVLRNKRGWTEFD